jgi:hypothetical protein
MLRRHFMCGLCLESWHEGVKGLHRSRWSLIVRSFSAPVAIRGSAGRSPLTSNGNEASVVRTQIERTATTHAK